MTLIELVIVVSVCLTIAFVWFMLDVIWIWGISQPVKMQKYVVFKQRPQLFGIPEYYIHSGHITWIMAKYAERQILKCGLNAMVQKNPARQGK